jgi:HSP20 family molecular chaperone IbpA
MTAATKQEVAKRDATEVQAATPREELLTMAPAVDIFENAQGITVQAELPGVSRERLSIQADRNNLVIEGDAVIDLPAGMEAIYADVQATRYRRSFALSGELDTERIEASLKDGVLTLTIPKRAEFRPRKVEVRTA